MYKTGYHSLIVTYLVTLSRGSFRA